MGLSGGRHLVSRVLAGMSALSGEFSRMRSLSSAMPLRRRNLTDAVKLGVAEKDIDAPTLGRSASMSRTFLISSAPVVHMTGSKAGAYTFMGELHADTASAVLQAVEAPAGR